MYPPNDRTQRSPGSPLLSMDETITSNSFQSTAPAIYPSTRKSQRSVTIHIDYHNAEKLTKRIIGVLKWAPFRFSHPLYIFIVAIMIIFNSIYTVVIIFDAEERFCTMLGWLMLSFQIESLLLYWYAYWNVDLEFVEDLAKVLAKCENQDPIHSFKVHILRATMIMIFSYLSGFFIFFEHHSKQKELKHIEIASNVLDFFRYIPQIFHIALVWLFYSTFPIQLQKLRKKWNIPDGKSRVEIIELLNHDQLNISHHELKCEFEKLVRPYYIITRKGKTIAWIMNYLFLNLVTMAFWWISVLSNECRGKKMDIYYTHYAIELMSFFVGWVYVIFPFYKNQKILSRLVEDIRKITHVDIQQYIAIMIYLDGVVRKSPVSISGYKITLYKLLKILLIVFGSVLFDVVARFNQIKIFG